MSNLRDNKLDSLSTNNHDMKGRRTINASPSQDPNDYIIRDELDKALEVNAATAKKSIKLVETSVALLGSTAPNIVSATSLALTYKITSNKTAVVFSATINLPTTDVSYLTHFIQVIIFAIDPTTKEHIEIARYKRPAAGTTISFSGWSNKILQIPNTSQANWELWFVCYNEYDTPTDNPVKITSITIPASTITVLSATDATSSRWQDSDGALHAVVPVTVTCNDYPQIITLWTKFATSTGPGYDQTMHGWFEFDSSSTLNLGAIASGTTLFPPISASEVVTVYAAIGTYDSSVALGGIPGIVSTTVTVAPPTTPSATAATAAYIDAITYAQTGAGGSWLFGWTHLYVTLPLTDSNFFFARLYVETGHYIAGVWTPGGQHPTWTSLGDWGSVPNDPRNDPNFHQVGSTNQIYDYNPNWWDVPTDGNNIFRFKWVVASRLSGGTEVQQNCWSAAVGTSTPGTNAFQEATIDPTKAAVPWGGISGPIDTGGGGSAQEIQSIKNAAGTVVAWFGKKTVGGVDYYGIWGKNVWVGGTDPTNPKIWLDGSGNGHFLGTIESASSISIVTADGTVSLDSTTSAVKIVNGSNNSVIGSGGIFFNQTGPTLASSVTLTQFSLCNGQFAGNTSGIVTKYANQVTAGYGLAPIVYSYSSSGNTGLVSFEILPNGAHANGLYEVSVSVAFDLTSGAVAGNVNVNIPFVYGGIYQPAEITSWLPASQSTSFFPTYTIRTDGSFDAGLGRNGLNLVVGINVALTGCTYRVSAIVKLLGP